MTEPTPNKISKSHLKEFSITVQTALNFVFNLFSLKSTEHFWGVVYDAVNKQPLDPVIVKLLYADGREAETCVTDLNGGYGFLAQPGKFKIFARKANYTFPSTKAPGSSDGIYRNLYHGEFFELSGDSEVVAPNIPMDPESADWNQTAKTAMFKKYPFLQLLGKKLALVLFWFGGMFVILGIIHNFPSGPLWLWVVAGFYILFIVLSVMVPETRLWGKINSLNSEIAAAGLSLELHNPQFASVIFGKVQVRADGKFLLRAGKGAYELWVLKLDAKKQKTLLASLPIKIGSAGVFNSTVFLK